MVRLLVGGEGVLAMADVLRNPLAKLYNALLLPFTLLTHRSQNASLCVLNAFVVSVACFVYFHIFVFSDSWVSYFHIFSFGAFGAKTNTFYIPKTRGKY